MSDLAEEEQMNCAAARDWIFRYLDEELTVPEQDRLKTHLSQCRLCAREMKLLLFPRRLSQAIPAFKPQPFFYQRLRAKLESESQSVTVWQIILGLSRQVVPTLSAITLVLVTIFAYMQLRGPDGDVYQAYDMVLMPEERAESIVLAELSEITDETVLRALVTDERDEPGDTLRK